MGVEIIRINAVLSSTGLELELSMAIRLISIVSQPKKVVIDVSTNNKLKRVKQD